MRWKVSEGGGWRWSWRMVEVYAGGEGGGDVAPVLLVSTVRPAQHSEGRVRLSDVQPLSLPKLDIKHYSDYRDIFAIIDMKLVPSKMSYKNRVLVTVASCFH